MNQLMTKIIFIAVAFLSIEGARAQKLTTFILLRHAEKINDGSKNPGLTNEGKKRAEKLTGFLKTPLLMQFTPPILSVRAKPFRHWPNQER